MSSPLFPCLTPGGKNEGVVCETPAAFFAGLAREFAFETDVCALPGNAKCPRYFTPEMDGLSQEWSGVCWMNPPYGREIADWMRKAHESSLGGATVVCLVPCRTDTRWWHDYAMKGEVRFVRGRLRFGDAKNFAPFPSAVVVFRPAHERDDAVPATTPGIAMADDATAG